MMDGRVAAIKAVLISNDLGNKVSSGSARAKGRSDVHREAAQRQELGKRREEQAPRCPGGAAGISLPRCTQEGNVLGWTRGQRGARPVAGEGGCEAEDKTAAGGDRCCPGMQRRAAGPDGSALLCRSR